MPLVKQPIRVAQIMGKMNGGGVESVVMNYYRHIDRSKVQFDFLVDADSTLVPREEIESMGGRVFEIPPYQRILEYQRTLEDLFRRERWQIVHSHVNALSVFPLRAAKKVGVPVRIAHGHSSNGGGRGEFAKDVLKAILKTQSRRYPTDLLACSSLAGDWLFGEGTHYAVLPNAVDLRSFASNATRRAAARASLGISDDTFVVGHIGRMAPQKNQLFLVDVFECLLDAEPDSMLILAGVGPLLEEVRERAASLGDKAVFLGQRSDAAELYQAFDAFCLPSIYEGLPVVGVECQASGTPILVSTEVTHEAAFTSLMEFEPLSSSADVWASHLLSMRGRTLSSEDMQGLEKYDIDVAAVQLVDLYFRIVKGCGE